LPKVLSSYPLSPQRGERVRVRGDKKKLLASSIDRQPVRICKPREWYLQNLPKKIQFE
jgi:hypothetical protein